MNPNRNGKIARLPENIRNELNRRLHAGEGGRSVIAWLNSLSEVQQALRKRFHGKPISAANLTEWKRGGYRDWLAEHQTGLPPRPRLNWQPHQWQPQPCQQQQAKHAHSPEPQPQEDPVDDEAADTSDENTDAAAISDQLAIRLGLELTRFTETWLTKGTWSRERWLRLRELLAALAQLRRGDHRAANLDMAQGRWEAEVNQREAELNEKDLKEIKQAKLNPIHAAMRLPLNADIHGGTEDGWRLAAHLLEIEFDLLPGTLIRPGSRPWEKGKAVTRNSNQKPGDSA